jgi:methyl coenzyme M reductase alpha subunit
MPKTDWTWARVTVLVFGMVLVIGFAYAWALSVLWGWFVADLFHLPQLSILGAYGLLLAYQALARPEYNTKEYEGLEWGPMIGAMAGKGIVGPVLGVLFGWFIKQWM